MRRQFVNDPQDHVREGAGRLRARECAASCAGTVIPASSSGRRRRPHPRSACSPGVVRVTSRCIPASSVRDARRRRSRRDLLEPDRRAGRGRNAGHRHRRRRAAHRQELHGRQAELLDRGRARRRRRDRGPDRDRGRRPGDGQRRPRLARTSRDRRGRRGREGVRRSRRARRAAFRAQSTGRSRRRAARARWR